MKRRYLNIVSKAVLIISLVIITNSYFTGCYTIGLGNSEGYSQPPMEYNIDELNEYGQWLEISPYGRVWQPSVVSDWEPFQYGHWLYSDNNWAWISYEPFGWVVYHYGYWYDDVKYGWVWVPENKGWSPAIVQWRHFDDYIAWAPLTPSGIIYKEPWEESNPRHWHTVKSDSFLKDNVGQLNEVSPKLRSNTGDRVTTAQPSKPKNADKKNQVTNQSPVRRDIEDKTGQKVSTENVTKERVRTETSNLDRMNLSDSEKKRVENHEKEVKQNVLVPKKDQNSSEKKDDSKTEKKEEKKTERRR